MRLKKFCETPDDSLMSVLHIGNSMNPILNTSDILKVESYSNLKIKSGDIIVFLPPGLDHKVTHRIISINLNNIRTQGDNNDDIDPWVLSPEDILGYVKFVQRKNKQFRLHRGLRGQLLVTIIRTFRAVKLKIFSVFRPLYNYLSQSGIFRQPWLLNYMKIRVLSFKKGESLELQLVMGKHLIGRRLSKGQWKIRYPFKLFIDETSLH